MEDRLAPEEKRNAMQSESRRCNSYGLGDRRLNECNEMSYAVKQLQQSGWRVEHSLAILILLRTLGVTKMVDDVDLRPPHFGSHAVRRLHTEFPLA
jgi:hypothetical protein